ncbi:hypothetical protein [Pyrodictium abyssi]|uniref:Uncharacterized protein n=1 Tax=Pyrodictium abyssi TaxID=54256 RepID=A0ABM8IUN3_9CREN|nr:hypothetical protein PABY_08260 [Pyrodictium abyssi]
MARVRAVIEVSLSLHGIGVDELEALGYTRTRLRLSNGGEYDGIVIEDGVKMVAYWGGREVHMRILRATIDDAEALHGVLAAIAKTVERICRVHECMEDERNG